VKSLICIAAPRFVVCADPPAGNLSNNKDTSAAEFEVLLRDVVVETDITAADRESLEAIGAVSPQGQTLRRAST
jgi:hypothetical protein